MEEIYKVLGELVAYARKNLDLDARDEYSAYNALLEILSLDGCEAEIPANSDYSAPDTLLEKLVSLAVESKRIEEWEGEALGDKVMGALSLLPSVIDGRFKAVMAEQGSKAATDWLYSYCVKNSYVKRAKLDKNPRFDVGGLTVTINKSKPEFRDPKKAKAGNSVAGGYPKCVICRANEGYAPRSKRTLRTVSLKLGGEDFFWQYSPYGYFHEHGIAVNTKHIPMYVDKTTFYKLMDFVDMFPHYFIGCNAPLERIGGSVLSHDHYQGGGEILPLHKAGIRRVFSDPDSPSVKLGILDWHGTVVRISGKDRDGIAETAEKLRLAWVNYNNPELGIICRDENGVHSAISPTVIKKGDGYEMNIILRSNITSAEYPDGIFHAHPEFHSIKKESIGLIEAQGLFILPGRLEAELKKVEDCIGRGELDKELEQFSLVYNETKNILSAFPKMGVHEAIKEELGSICQRILVNTAVFKEDEQTAEFLKGAGFYDD